MNCVKIIIIEAMLLEKIVLCKNDTKTINILIIIYSFTFIQNEVAFKLTTNTNSLAYSAS